MSLVYKRLIKGQVLLYIVGNDHSGRNSKWLTTILNPVHVCAHIHAHARTHAHPECVFTCIHACSTYVCMCVCVHVCVCVMCMYEDLDEVVIAV